MFAARETHDSLLISVVDVAGRLGLAAALAGMMICSVVSDFVSINDMGLMAPLVSLFHLSPWLKLLPVRSQHRNMPTTQMREAGNATRCCFIR